VPGRLTRALQGADAGGHAAWVVGLFALGGALGGLLWEAWWRPPVGLVADGRVVLVGDAARAAFDGTAQFVVVATVLGLLLGGLVGLLARGRERVTVVLVVLGAVLATAVMVWIGQAVGPPDPAPVAARSEDLTEVATQLRVRGLAAYTALPAGALVGLLAALVLAPGTGGIAGLKSAEVGSLHPEPADPPARS
jgi:hypothetical protein